MNRYVCVHGHFYQPPRENPWLEAIEQQDSALPYHDWNERITEECYHPNSRSRMLDEEGWIVRIVNNYSRMSFNFGPTLLSWLERHSPPTYRAIIDADSLSRERFNGHGSAMAQAYNHMIMPLASDRDRHTQALWGLRDFQKRFGRDPEGMWLPETAANTASLETLAELGIKFTLLAPRQAKRFRKIGDKQWTDIGDGGPIDPSRAYLQKLPSGRSIAVFFYDGPVSQAVAFERLLHSGPTFADRLTDAFDAKREWDQLAHIATDGESYGHHHRHGDMALAAALARIEERHDIGLINYGAYLEKHPPEHEVEIVEDSSWSCVHGVGRWKEDCGCHTGGRPDWNQAWRGPLRESLDWLRDELEGPYAEAAGELLKDPWAARDDYIDVILDRSDEGLQKFFSAHGRKALSDDERATALELLEMQRHAMLMYTSCGWFFDELSGIETVQVIEYAGRAVQLAGRLFDRDFETGFLERLEKAKSNLPRQGDGRRIYQTKVATKMLDFPAVAAHSAISSLFESEEGNGDVYCYGAEQTVDHDLRSGRGRVRIGTIHLTSKITRRSGDFRFAVVHLGDHNISGGVRAAEDFEDLDGFTAQCVSAFKKGDYVQLFKLIEKNFGPETYSLGSLFRDRQHDILDRLLDAELEGVRASYREIYERHSPLLHFHAELDVHAPRELLAAAEIVVNDDLARGLRRAPEDVGRLHGVLDRAESEDLNLDEESLAYVAESALLRIVKSWREQPESLERLKGLRDTLAFTDRLPFEVDRYRVQSIFYELATTARVSPPSDSDRKSLDEWDRTLHEVAQRLRLRIQE